MVTILYDIVRESVELWLAVAPYLLLGMFIAGILHVFLGEDFIRHHLGGKGMAPVVKATLFGIPLPICSCGVIPVAASLKKEGASKSSVLSFLVSTPTTGVDSILATYSLLGPLFAIFRPIAAFFSGITIGMVNRLFNKEKTTIKHDHSHKAIATGFKVKEVFRYGFLELAEDIGKWLLIGVILGALLTVFIPESFMTRHLANPMLHFLLVLVIAIPLYVCATGSIPIATALIAKGFSPGAALIFLIAGPATNTVTLSFVYSKLGKRAFYIYLSSIIVISLLAGLVFNWIWGLLGSDLSLISPHGSHLSLWLTIPSGIILFALIVFGLLPSRKKEVNEMDYEVNVPDMTCKHCKMTLENALNNVKGVEKVSVSLDEKIVGVDGKVKAEEVQEAIRNAGYTVEEKK